MTFRSTLKQMFRTPFRTVLFLLLILLASALLTVGANLFFSAARSRAEVSQQYATVGSIRQMPDSTKKELVNNGYEDVFIDTPEYTTQVPDGLFGGLPTKLPVENRPVVVTTGTKADGKELVTPRRYLKPWVITFIPEEDVDSTDEAFVENHPSHAGTGFKFKITPVTVNGKPAESFLRSSGALDKDCTVLWLYENTSVQLKAGTEYIALFSLFYSGDPKEFPLRIDAGIKSCRATKTSYEVESLDRLVYEAADPEAQALFEEYSAILAQVPDTGAFPTVPTNSLSLLEPFYQDQVTVKYGREITPEEFQSGAKVCMIPELFATDPPEGVYSNYLQVGDTIDLNWLGAIYGAPPSYVTPEEWLTGRSFEQMAGGTYEIVGVYTSDAIGYDLQNGSDMNLGYYQAIVPAKSFDFEALTILAGGPLQPGCCSFQLENGTALQFLEAFEKLGYESLQVTINDKGFTSIEKGLDALELVSMILLFAGGISTLCLLVFFIYLQITRQKREAAIQISLGSGKRRCFAAMLLSVMLVAVVGAAAGTLAGHTVTETLSERIYTQARESGYSREYSDRFDAAQDQEYTYQGGAMPLCSLLCGLSVAGCALLLALGAASQALKKEPLELLAQKEKE